MADIPFVAPANAHKARSRADKAMLEATLANQALQRELYEEARAKMGWTSKYRANHLDTKSKSK